MTIFYLKDMGLRRPALATFAACGLIIAASQGLCVRAQAEDATADYVAPLDMTSTYAGAIEYPDFLPDEMYRRAMAVPAPDTTGISSTASGSGRKDAAASQRKSPDETNASLEDFYKFAP